MYIRFKELFLKYYFSLCLYAFRIIRDMPAAEDLVQDVFSDTWEKRHELDISCSLKPYLYRVTYNKCVDYLRHLQLKEDKLNQPENTSMHDLYLKNSVHSQDETLHVNEMIREISICKERLPNQCRRIFDLSREEHLKNKEIAERLGISIKAVEKQLAKALKEIRSHLVKKGLIKE